MIPLHREQWYRSLERPEMISEGPSISGVEALELTRT